MKKSLLIAVGASLAITASAQTNHKPAVNGVKKAQTLINYHQEENVSPIKRQAKTPLLNRSGRTAYNRTQLGTYNPIKISSSANTYGFLVSNTQSVVANKDLNTIVFANRGSAETKPTGWNSGWLMAKFSKDFGSTWDSVWVYDVQGADGWARYPLTMLLNPAGNTDPANARIAMTGPATASAAGWPSFFQASVGFDGSNKSNVNNYYGTAGVPNNQFPRLNGGSCSNHGYAIGNWESNVDGQTLTARGFKGAMVNKAALNSGTVTWTYDSIIATYAIGSDGEPVGYESPISAWSEDGQTGYVVFYGVEHDATGQNISFQPIVWKTTDGGATYNHILYNYDWSSTNLDEEFLNPVGGQGGTLYKPWFSQATGTDAIVDANGELHLFTEIRSGSSYSLDSAGYSYNHSGFDAMLFDVSTKTTSTDAQWNVAFVDFKYAKDDANGGSFNDVANAIDARLQISVSADRTKMFYTWLDCDTTLASGNLDYPEIFVKGRDLTTNKWTETYLVSDDVGNAYWMYASDVALTNGNGDHVLPITITEDAYAYVGTGKQNVDFVDNAVIPSSAFTIADTLSSTGSAVPLSTVNTTATNLKVSVAPNPTNGVAKINVTLPNSSAITVNVYNALGALVETATLNGIAGVNTVKVNLENNASGIYSYKVVTACGNSNGKIMLVSK